MTPQIIIVQREMRLNVAANEFYRSKVSFRLRVQPIVNQSIFSLVEEKEIIYIAIVFLPTRTSVFNVHETETKIYIKIQSNVIILRKCTTGLLVTCNRCIVLRYMPILTIIMTNIVTQLIRR